MLIIKWLVIAVLLVIFWPLPPVSWASCKARGPPTWACATAS